MKKSTSLEKLHKSKAKLAEHPYAVPSSNKKVKEVKKVNVRASNDDLGEILTKSNDGSNKVIDASPRSILKKKQSK